MKSPITKAFENFSGEYLRLNSATIEQHKVIDSIKVCKTERLGFNVQACEDCGNITTHYNSCGNRHCPNCQAINKDKWILAKQNDLLPVKYHHTIFTIPAQLRPLFKYNKKPLYNLLFKCAWGTIDSFSNDKRNRIEAKMGMIAILHTWKQNLDFIRICIASSPRAGLRRTINGSRRPQKAIIFLIQKHWPRRFKGSFCGT